MSASRKRESSPAGARARIGADPEFDQVDALLAPIFRIGLDLDDEFGPFELQGRKFLHDGAGEQIGRAGAQFREVERHLVIRIAGFARFLFKRLKTPLARVEVGQIGQHRVAQFGKIIDTDGVFAGKRAQREQPFLGPFQHLRVEFDGAQSLVDGGLGRIERDQRLVERRDDRIDERRRFLGLALQAAQQASKLRHGRPLP